MKIWIAHVRLNKDESNEIKIMVKANTQLRAIKKAEDECLAKLKHITEAKVISIKEGTLDE